jgi:3-isopropylmalate/(R)-2-methylmalate dehydratase small subunit
MANPGMQPFRTLTSAVIPLPYNDVDTDQIIPARFLKVTDKVGLADGLFSGWRYLADGNPNPDFPLNQADYQGCQILLAGDNFACGSSREHAAWALLGWGIRAIISTSFADIFKNNALKNGLLPMVVDAETHRRLLDEVRDETKLQVTVDLATQKLYLPDGTAASFPIDPFSKICLLEGIDQLGFLLKHESGITAFENAHPRLD